LSIYEKDDREEGRAIARRLMEEEDEEDEEDWDESDESDDVAIDWEGVGMMMAAYGGRPY
jgi:hypothetical protein